MTRLDLNHLAVLEALVEEKSIARAAARLHMTPQAVSAALRRLRAFTGEALLERDGRGLRPTERAMEIVKPVRTALGRLREALAADPGSGKPVVRGRVRIGMIEYACELLLPRIAQLVEEHAPGVDLVVTEIDSAALGLRLAAAHCDLVVARAVPVPATIHRRILLREGWKVLLRSDHPAGSALGVEEYCRLPHAVQIVGAARQQSTVDIELARHGAKRDIALVASTSVPAVMAGRDFAVTVPDSVALLRAMARGLRVADPPVKIPAFELMMAWHRKRETDTLHRMLRGFVARACELL